MRENKTPDTFVLSSFLSSFFAESDTAPIASNGITHTRTLLPPKLKGKKKSSSACFSSSSH